MTKPALESRSNLSQSSPRRTTLRGYNLEHEACVESSAAHHVQWATRGSEMLYNSLFLCRLAYMIHFPTKPFFLSRTQIYSILYIIYPVALPPKIHTHIHTYIVRLLSEGSLVRPRDRIAVFTITYRPKCLPLHCENQLFVFQKLERKPWATQVTWPPGFDSGVIDASQRRCPEAGLPPAPTLSSGREVGVAGF